MIELRFSLPWGVSANAYWRSINMPPGADKVEPLIEQFLAARGVNDFRRLLKAAFAMVRSVVLLSTEAREYRAKVLGALLEQGIPRRELDGKLELELVVCPPNRLRRDLSNTLKPLEDALVFAKVVRDDRFFCRHVLAWGPIIEGGIVHVVVRQLECAVEQGALELGGDEPTAAPPQRQRVISAAEFRKMRITR